LKLAREAQKQLETLIADAKPLSGDFFRSVAFRYFHPDAVISGEGTRLAGGRFVPIGVNAVYGSFDEETALREVTARKKALGGRAQIDIGEYPRLTYVITVKTRRSIDLAAKLPVELAAVVSRCVRANQYSASQELAAIWIGQGIDSVVFPSATGSGRNLVVYLANAGAGSVAIRNRDQILAALRAANRRRTRRNQ
jgi:RES domain-containing protein